MARPLQPPCQRKIRADAGFRAPRRRQAHASARQEIPPHRQFEPVLNHVRFILRPVHSRRAAIVAKKDKQAPEADADARDGEAAPEGDAPKKGFLNRILGNKLILFGAIGAIVLLIGGGTAYWFLFAGDSKPTELAAGAPEPLPPTPPNVAFYDVPDIIVNIQGTDATPAYLKLSVSLELDGPEEEAGLKALMPRVVDQFQGYLRELRVDDLKGSAGIARLKEELMRRINLSAAPYRVRDVLLKQMIVQ
jgi:flagellar protein FliL